MAHRPTTVSNASIIATVVLTDAQRMCCTDCELRANRSIQTPRLVVRQECACAEQGGEQRLSGGRPASATRWASPATR